MTGTVPGRVGILCNPGSGRASRHLPRLRRYAEALPGGLYREATDLPAMAGVVREFMAAEIQTLVVVAGDGTLHALMGLILESGARQLPVVAVVPAGTTNMTAADLGVRGSPERVLARTIKQLSGAAPASITTRSVLRVESSPDTIHYGMFFGAGIIAAGVRYFEERVRKFKMTGETGPGLVMARFMIPLLLGRGAGASTPVRMVENGVDAGSGSRLLVFATTLDRLLLGTRPYWGGEPAPIHATAIAARPRYLLLRLPGILRGRGEGLREEAGYHSRNLDSLELDMQGDFVVDGQLYNAVQGPVRITADSTLRFLVPRAGR